MSLFDILAIEPFVLESRPLVDDGNCCRSVKIAFVSLSQS